MTSMHEDVGRYSKIHTEKDRNTYRQERQTLQKDKQFERRSLKTNILK